MQSYSREVRLGRLRQRECDREDGTLAELAFHRNRPTEQFGVFFNDIKSKSDAAIFARRGTIHLLEHVKNGPQLIAGNSDAGVSNFELDATGFRGAPGQNRHASLFGKLYGIVNQILQDAFEFLIVSLDSWQVGGVVPK